MSGMTAEEVFHYSEYCRLAEEACALYRKWDMAMVPDRIKKPHYAKAAELRRQADEHKQKYIDLGRQDAINPI